LERLKRIHKSAVNTEEDFGTCEGLMMCFLRDMPESFADEALEYAMRYKAGELELA
jgi:hypothetical protein